MHFPQELRKSQKSKISKGCNNEVPEIPGCALYSCAETSGYTDSGRIPQYKIILVTRPFAKKVQTNLANILAKYYNWLGYDKAQAPLCCVYSLPLRHPAISPRLAAGSHPPAFNKCSRLRSFAAGSGEAEVHGVRQRPRNKCCSLPRQHFVEHRTPCASSPMWMSRSWTTDLRRGRGICHQTKLFSRTNDLERGFA